MSPPRRVFDFDEELRAAVRIYASSFVGARRVAADTSGLLRVTEALPLSSLSHWERTIRSEFSSIWREEVVSKRTGWRALFLPSPRAEHARPLSWFDLSSFDGRVRERTLRTLAGSAPNAFLFALAAQRLNDWVPQVRAAAREAIPVLARASDPEHVAAALCAMLATWTAWGRLDDTDRQVALELASIASVSAALRRRLMTSAAGPVSRVLSQLLRTPTFDADLPEIAAMAIQPSVRARAYRALLARKATWVEGRQWLWIDVRYCQGRFANVLGERSLDGPPIHKALQSAMDDRSPIVRRVAAEVLVREMNTLGDVVPTIARQLAADPCPAIAERGEFVLKQLGV